MHQTAFLEYNEIRKPSDEAREHLDSSLSVEEVLEAISIMNHVKTPGLDSLPIDIFKALKEIFIYNPHLNMSVNGKQKPSSFPKKSVDYTNTQAR